MWIYCYTPGSLLLHLAVSAPPTATVPGGGGSKFLLCGVLLRCTNVVVSEQLKIQILRGLFRRVNHAISYARAWIFETGSGTEATAGSGAANISVVVPISDGYQVIFTICYREASTSCIKFKSITLVNNETALCLPWLRSAVLS